MSVRTTAEEVSRDPAQNDTSKISGIAPPTIQTFDLKAVKQLWTHDISAIQLTAVAVGAVPPTGLSRQLVNSSTLEIALRPGGQYR